jgi:hypothetical protein
VTEPASQRLEQYGDLIGLEDDLNLRVAASHAFLLESVVCAPST